MALHLQGLTLSPPGMDDSAKAPQVAAIPWCKSPANLLWTSPSRRAGLPKCCIMK